MTNNKTNQLKWLAEDLIKNLDAYKLNEAWIGDQDHELALDNVSDEDHQRGSENLNALIEDRKKLYSKINMCVEDLNFVYDNEL